MQVEIGDSLYEKYQQLVKKYHLARDVSSRLQQLMEKELHSWGEGGQTDPLTGCKTRSQLAEDIRRATSESGQDFYRSDFACVDIADFMTYLDNTGLAAGDGVLADIGTQLRETYSDPDVYRFGGDEFVIELRGRPYRPAQTPAEIRLKHSVVRVVAKKNPPRNHYINRAIIFHLDRGIVEAAPGGTEINCEIVAP